ncbi:MAG TPA: membrane dipeptidase [Candidatus Binatia bacterium]|nr:membrane dipeptidase [Candidatus Binatia bacterium]
MRRRTGIVAAAGVAVGTAAAGAAAALAIAGGPVGRRLVARGDRRRNVVTGDPRAVVSDRARELHATLRVVDLHADTLLWGRDLLVRGATGHLDVPRLIEGRVALQGLAVATKVPHGLSMERNVDRFDDVTLVALGLGWPRPALRDPLARALHLAEQARYAAEASEERLTIVRSATDLHGHLARLDGGLEATAAFLALEGAHPLVGGPGSVDVLVDVLFDAGYRMVGPSHFLDTPFGGSAHGVARGGLTELGRELVDSLEARSILIDLAHASPALFDDVVADARRPVVVSHAGVRATADSARNLTDEQLKAVAATGGLFGTGFWPMATGGEDVASLVRAIDHAVGVVGFRHVALGSDFDGAVSAPFDASGLAHLTDGLLEAGFSESTIRAVMGENALRFLGELLPAA